MYIKRGYIPDGSGVWYGDKISPQYADCCHDVTSFCTYQKSCNNENGVEQGEANHMTKEVFAKPCVGAIIKKVVGNEPYILLQTRQKEDGNETNGMFEIPAGKIREYEDVFSALRREVWEETGLKITKIYGEDSSVCTQIGDVTTISFTPYCVTQNLSGAYSIILKHIFM